ncbi:MAG TPA: hypothetical protein VNS09_16200 [Solirubrobacter sp.]|nr:hypothetical protein [Solirubrobacter sp.]
MSLVVAAITVTTSTTAAHAAKRARPCPPAGARVLASDVDARVYRIRPKKLPGITDFYACMTRGRGHRYLGYETDGLSTFVYRTFRLASPYLADVQYTYSTAGSHVTPTIRNIRTGTKVKVDVADAVYGLEITRRGGLLILWGGQNPRDPLISPKAPPQLLYRSRLGQRLVLDTGDGIDRSSLAVSRDGTRAYWLKDGIAATAVLP